VNTGQVVLSRIDARYGAIGFVPSDLDGAIITGDFWAFDVNTTEVLSKYLNLFFSLPIFAKLCERASRGTTRRQRLEFDLFTAISIPWVPLAEQRVIIEKVATASNSATIITNLADDIRGLPREIVQRTFGFDWVEANAERMHVSDTDLEDL
jgi:type I restriction enzyme S subunit